MEETTKNNERKKYVLQVQRGEELSLHRLEEICNEESIMRPSYEKAMRALMQIMRRTKRFHEENDNQTEVSDIFSLETQLFGYSGNIIAFAAPRGGGKTATMLSFAKILNEGFGRHSTFENTDNSFLNAEIGEEKEKAKEDEWLRRCKFIPMAPIAPAVLEGEQNILYVVLSRLYRYAERLITERGRLDRIQETQKNQIIRSFQKVLSGINGIKHPEKKHPGDLISMQDVCDGLSLSRHFYDLVQHILKLAAGNQGISDRYLVIQLDDADSKMQRVYEVLEDVRKYLMIPNLVILMSVDPNCMSDVVFQDNLRCFPDLIKVDPDRLSHDLSKITNKYIDKLIPPTHMAQLPQLDQIMIHWGDMLRLRYVDEKGHDVYGWMNDEKQDLQTALLMLIYYKTHILFVKPHHYLHNIIPRTLRGFVQLLSLLDSMDNIPELNFATYADVKEYAKDLLKQSEIAAINQRRFADYFKNRWINVKITDLEDLEFLRKFADTVSTNRIRLAVKHLCKRYGKSFENNKPKYFADRGIEIKDIKEREDLDQLMWEIDQIHRTESDFRLMFALRTLFTLDSHQHILKLKRETARGYLMDTKEKRVLMFDLRPDYIRVPKKLVVEDAAKKCKIEKSKISAYAELLTPLLGDERIIRKVDGLAKSDPEILKFQQLIHTMQDLAVVLYANCDASYTVRTSLKRYVERPDSNSKSPDSASVMIDSMLKLVSSFNDGNPDRLHIELKQYGNRYMNVLNELSSIIMDTFSKSKTKAKTKSSTRSSTRKSKEKKQHDEEQKKVENDVADPEDFKENQEQ